jgi:hypothetical protein
MTFNGVQSGSDDLSVVSVYLCGVFHFSVLAGIGFSLPTAYACLGLIACYIRLVLLQRLHHAARQPLPSALFHTQYIVLNVAHLLPVVNSAVPRHFLEVSPLPRCTLDVVPTLGFGCRLRIDMCAFAACVCAAMNSLPSLRVYVLPVEM